MTMNRTELQTQLSAIANEYDDKTTENNIEEMMDQAREKMNNIVSPLFGDKDIFALHSGEFSVHCKTDAEREDAIKTAQKMGYVNVSTYEPKVSDGTELGSMPHPDFMFAVRVNNSESLIFGAHSKELISLLDNLVAPAKDFVTYTYCYNDDYRLTFRVEEVATVYFEALKTYFDEMTKYATANNKKAPAFDVTYDSSEYDTTTVRVKLIA